MCACLVIGSKTSRYMYWMFSFWHITHPGHILFRYAAWTHLVNIHKLTARPYFLLLTMSLARNILGIQFRLIALHFNQIRTNTCLSRRKWGMALIQRNMSRIWKAITSRSTMIFPHQSFFSLESLLFLCLDSQNWIRIQLTNCGYDAFKLADKASLH